MEVVFAAQGTTEKERERESRKAGNPLFDIFKKQPRYFQGELFPECETCGGTQHEKAFGLLPSCILTAFIFSRAF